MVTAAQISHGRAAVVPKAPGAAAAPNRFGRLMLLLFMIGMVVPIWIRVGPILLMPHRVVLLLLFVPLMGILLSGKAGRLRSFDVLMMASALWAALSLWIKGSVLGASIPQQMGIYMLETFGAYLLARVTIRSAEDFAYFTRIFFISLLILVPFGIIEAVTHRAVMLELIPKSVTIVYTAERWGLRRAQTVFGHPILFGVFCSVGFGLFWYAMRSHLTRVGGTVMAFVGTFVSLSSGALVSISMQLSFMAWEMIMKPVPRRWTIFAILSALFYITIDLLSNRTPFHVLIDYATFNSGSAYNRILIWRFGMENVWDRPFFGLGADITLWDRPYWMSPSADNYWLLMTMQYGIPCFLFTAAALFIIIRKVALAPLKDPLSIACRAGYLTAVGGLIIAGGTVHFWHGVMAFVTFFFGTGVWAIDAGTREVAREGEAEGQEGAAPEGPDYSGLVYTRQAARHSRNRPASATPTRARRVSRMRGG
jgi:hypothetical protein